LAFFFWGIIALVFFGIWFATLIGFISSRFFKSKVVRWLGFLPFAGMTGYAIWLAATLYYLSTPPKVFERTFGFAPTGDVREIQSQYWYFGDTGSTYLKFKAEPQTIQRIVKIGLDQRPIPEVNNYLSAESDPQWWQPQPGSITHFYMQANRLKDFASENEMLCYDERTQQAYYMFLGID